MGKRSYQGSFLNKKWFVVLVAILIALLLFFIATGKAENKQMSIEEATGEDIGTITKIIFRDGRGMNQPFTLEEAGKIDVFVKKLSSYVVKKEQEHEPSVGWLQAADFYEGKKKLMTITFTDPLTINESYYEIIKGQLQPDEIEQFIQAANPNWKKK
ncbi:hypothetical protein [Neobacillus piezotolerans]|uniref:hypothetical protein n=1 Tax=Neobacillus piezotolerans TaxID=2259171 RepID=UPI00115B1848|nr:hypothetical protein [Neobacillus piezotolerans]